jgi:hypothetical protein
MSGSKILYLIQEPGGSFVWTSGERIVARVFALDGGSWRVSWQLETWKERRLGDLFPSSHAACLAAEKFWHEGVVGWVESIQGGFFRQLGHARKCVRQNAQGYYGVRDDGKVLGRSGQAMWFASASDAMAAIEKDHYTPADADPFRANRQRLAWLTIADRRAA